MNSGALSMAFRLGVRQALAQPSAVTGQMVILAALLISYGALLPAIPQADLQRLGLTASQMIWYLVLTETVVLVSIWNIRQLQQSVKSGAIDLWLIRPIEFWQMLVAEWAGRELPRLVPLGIVGFTIGRIMSGGWEIDTINLLIMVPTAIIGTLILLCWHFVIGIIPVWISESSPILWLHQKFLFLLGGLMWPLVLYPVWMRTLAWLTFFPAVLATIGDLALPQSASTILFHAAGQIFWLALSCAVCAFIARAAARRLGR